MHNEVPSDTAWPVAYLTGSLFLGALLISAYLVLFKVPYASRRGDDVTPTLDPAKLRVGIIKETLLEYWPLDRMYYYTMSNFKLPNWPTEVVVTLPTNITKDELLAFAPFDNWLQTLRKSLDEQSAKDHVFYKKNERYTLRSISVQSVDWFPTSPKRIGFVKMEAVVRNDTDKNALPGIVFLRGGSVAILMIVHQEGDPEDERWVIMTKQPRIPAGSLTFYEIPAGMLDDEKNYEVAAARELWEETGLKFPASALTDLTARALEQASGTESHLQKAMYPSPGGCDEYIKLFFWEGTKPVSWFNQYKDKMRGTDREKIMVKLVKYEELWKEGARDAKTLAAWALYEGLTRAGTLYKTHSNTS